MTPHEATTARVLKAIAGLALTAAVSTSSAQLFTATAATDARAAESRKADARTVEARTTVATRGVTSSGSRAISSTRVQSRTVRAPGLDAPTNPGIRATRVTQESIDWSLIAHESRRTIAAERLTQLQAERLRDPLDRVVERFLSSTVPGNQVEWDVPQPPMTKMSAAGSQLDKAGVSRMIDDIPGGVYVPRSWGVVETPFGPERQIPYTFDAEIIDEFFFPEDGTFTDPNQYNENQSLPNILALLLLLETDLDGDQDGSVPGSLITTPIKFVGYNPLIHDRAIIFRSISLDPAIRAEFLGLVEDNTLDGVEVCLNSIDGFGAPSIDAGAGFVLPDGDAGRQIFHCDWSDVGSLTRQIGFALGLTWHQTRSDRDDFIDIFPETVIPLDTGTPPVPFPIGTHTTVARNQFGTQIPDGFVTLGSYDPFSIVHQDAFSLSINGLPVFEPLDALLLTEAVAIENQRRDDAGIPEIPGTSPAATDAQKDAGLLELRNLMGFAIEFSPGDLRTIETIFTEDATFVGTNPLCPVDLDGDFDQDFDDVLAFGDLVLANDAAADLDGSGFITANDFALFIDPTSYVAGVCDPEEVLPITLNGCDFDLASAPNPDGSINFTPDGVQNWYDRLAFAQLFLDDQARAADPTLVVRTGITDLFPDGVFNQADLAAFDGRFNPGVCQLGVPVPVADVCPNDVNVDGVQNFNDLVEFSNLVAANNPAADVNFDGVVNFVDYGIFQATVIAANGVCTPVIGPVTDNCPFDIASFDPATGGISMTPDGRQDFNDRLAFANLITQQSIAADLTGNGIIDSLDYFAFDAQFADGFCNPGGAALVPNGCPFDVNNDGAQDWFDRVTFANLVAANDRVTDLTFDNRFEGIDVAALLARFNVGVCDLGSTVPEPTFCPLDLNNDTVQDWTDILLFEGLLASGAPVADFNFDDVVDFLDRNAFRAQTVFSGGVFFGTCDVGTQQAIFNGCTIDLAGPPNADGTVNFGPDGNQNWYDRLAYAELLMQGNLITDINGNGVIDPGVVGDGGDFAAFRIAAAGGTAATGSLFLNLGTCVATGAAIPQPDGCDFDINVDGFQNAQDLALFGNLVASGNPAADLNGDSFVDEFDVNVFNGAFQTGECEIGQIGGPTADGCPFDFDGNGIQSAADIVIFIDLWESNNPIADFNGDGNLDVFDLQDFNDAFVPGFCSEDTPFPDPDNRPDLGNLFPS